MCSANKLCLSATIIHDSRKQIKARVRTKHLFDVYPLDILPSFSKWYSEEYTQCVLRV